MKEGVSPMILNLTQPEDYELNYAMTNIKRDVNIVIKNGLGFGGINDCLIFKKISDWLPSIKVREQL